MAKKSKKDELINILPESRTTLKNRIISCAPGCIFVDTAEEGRLIKDVYEDFRGHRVQFWSVTQGLINIDNKIVPEDFRTHKCGATEARASKNGSINSITHGLVGALSIIEEDCRDPSIRNGATPVKSIYIMRDADVFFSQPSPIRKLKDIMYLLSANDSCIIFIGCGITVPTTIEKDAVLLKYDFPTKHHISNVMLPNIKSQIDSLNSDPLISEENKLDNSFDIAEITNACVGLTEEQIVTSISYSVAVKKKICVDIILEEKRSIINKNDILEYWVCNDSLDSIGGFANLKQWFNVRKTVMNSPYSSQFKAKTPKGILLLGLQGSGKTAIAKALAQSWNVGLIKLDMGKVFAGLVGESEKRMRMALRQIEAAGGIVVIDEIDKGLSGAGSSDKTDGGTTSRVIGTLLTWLQEDHPGVFLIATANDITNLNKNHPELLRKGRFDEIWFSDMPNTEERKEIFKIHLNKRLRDPSRFDLDLLSSIDYIDESDTKNFGYTGAEIEYAIDDAIMEKFALLGGKEIAINSKDDITTEDIAAKLRLIKPIAYISRDTISAMRKWSATNARSVTVDTPSKVKTTKVERTKGPLNLTNVSL